MYKDIRISVMAFLIAVLAFLMPLSADAGLVRVYFDFDIGSPVEVYSTSYIEISDTFEYGEWFNPSSLFYSNYMFDIAIMRQEVAFTFRTDPLEGLPSASIRINDLGGNVFTCDVASLEAFGLGDMISYNDPYMTIFDTPTRLLIENGEAVAHMSFAYFGPQGGDLGLSTSVWFDDPPPQVPIPPTVVLLLSALLPVLGIKKWRRK